ncbi:MAG TPA: hypothetical protein VJ974_05200 [Geopsychrobacteraceae bacterium]|nr:hypothetical protein [Geopsychrobacteraceae bacterium]
MGWFGFLLLLLMVAGGVYFYQKLLSIEREILQERAVPKPEAQSIPGDNVVEPEVAPPIFKEQVKLEPAVPDDNVDGPTNLEDALIKVVTDLPGLLQTELYELFPGEERKRLQALLLQLDRKGVIRREKKKSSYRVFPV